MSTLRCCKIGRPISKFSHDRSSSTTRYLTFLRVEFLEERYSIHSGAIQVLKKVNLSGVEFFFNAAWRCPFFIAEMFSIPSKAHISAILGNTKLSSKQLSHLPCTEHTQETSEIVIAQVGRSAGPTQCSLPAVLSEYFSHTLGFCVLIAVSDLVVLAALSSSLFISIAALISGEASGQSSIRCLNTFLAH